MAAGGPHGRGGASAHAPPPLAARGSMCRHRKNATGGVDQPLPFLSLAGSGVHGDLQTQTKSAKHNNTHQCSSYADLGSMFSPLMELGCVVEEEEEHES